MSEYQKIVSVLNPRPENNELFKIGKLSVQQDKCTVISAMREILARIGQKDKEFIRDPFYYRNGWLARWLCDNSSLAWEAWFRFRCMDNDFMEWYQPYYANK